MILNQRLFTPQGTVSEDIFGCQMVGGDATDINWVQAKDTASHPILYIIWHKMSMVLRLKGFPGGAAVKNPPANAGDSRDTDLIPELGRSPGGGNGNPVQYSCWEIPWTEELAGNGPWGHKGSDTTE